MILGTSAGDVKALGGANGPGVGGASVGYLLVAGSRVVPGVGVGGFPHCQELWWPVSVVGVGRADFGVICSVGRWFVKAITNGLSICI